LTLLASGSTFNDRAALLSPSYLKDLPEAIKAHPARAGAAKPTGVWKFRNSNFGFRNFRRERMGNCGLGLRKQTTLVRVRKSAIRNPNSEILSTWLGYRKQEQYREVIFLLIRASSIFPSSINPVKPQLTRVSRSPIGGCLSLRGVPAWPAFTGEGELFSVPAAMALGTFAYER
jgi:hypothetical protein